MVDATVTFHIQVTPWIVKNGFNRHDGRSSAQSTPANSCYSLSFQSLGKSSLAHSALCLGPDVTEPSHVL